MIKTEAKTSKKKCQWCRKILETGKYFCSKSCRDSKIVDETTDVLFDPV